ncbi:uncharacterized protein LOC119592963 [Penaeus monodon]|uniref:uncharacterized protein LOC119592963 n=1 Tax=Penaeus monodon TaxID=6687 RepID=UPI0018A6E2ED|nr:uncharacterized protein LOC119592963 [Penaeus monodon]
MGNAGALSRLPVDQDTSEVASSILLVDACPFRGLTFLIVVDSFSKWPEVILMTSTTAHSTVRVLLSLFATHDIPQQTVSDNGPQFVLSESENFCKGNNIKHTAPYRPAINGEAEGFVQTFKNSIGTVADPVSLLVYLGSYYPIEPFLMRP